LQFFELGTDTCQDINLRIIPTYSPILKIFKKSPLVYKHGSQKYGKVKELGKEPPVLHQLKVLS
jgi:hypothetical protein